MTDSNDKDGPRGPRPRAFPPRDRSGEAPRQARPSFGKVRPGAGQARSDTVGIRPERPRAAKPSGNADGAEPGRRRIRPQQVASEAAAIEERIAKVVARAGIASRRDVEAMIAEGRVTLNGARVESPALNVSTADLITVDGEPLPARERTRLWLFHKPRGLVTTFRDPQGRQTVFDALPEELPRVVAVGRLDINTEGLLLLTNDGGLARVVAHPETGWLRRYRVRANGEVTQDLLDRLKAGITVEGITYGPIEASLDRVQGDNTWLTLGLREGKNREVKRVLEHLGLTVSRLIRLSFGPFQLGELEPGLVEEVRTRVLRDQLGTTLSEEAGVDFTGPVREPIAPFGSKGADQAAPRPSTPRGGRTGRPAAKAGGPKRDFDGGGRSGRGHSGGGHSGWADRPRTGRNKSEPFRPRERSFGQARPGPDRGGHPDRAARDDRPGGRDERSSRPAGPPRDRPAGPGRSAPRGRSSPDDRPGRRDGPPRGERPERPPRREKASRQVWRAGEESQEGVAPRRPKPRRDPKTEREAGAGKQRERVGAIKTGRGRSVLVERAVTIADAGERAPRARGAGAKPGMGKARPGKPGSGRPGPGRAGPRQPRRDGPDRSGPRPER